MNELTPYTQYTYDQLAAMGKVYYSGKANPWQSQKYELIRSFLLVELRQFNPGAPDTGSACYLHAAIGACLQSKRDEEKAEQERMRANAQNAHTQLKAWEWEGLK